MTLVSLRSSNVNLPRFSLPAALVLGLTLLIGLSIVFWTTHNSNQQAIEQQQGHLHSLIDQDLKNMVKHLTYVMTSQPMIGALRGESQPYDIQARYQEKANAFERFDGVFLVRPNDAIEWGNQDGSLVSPFAFEFRSLFDEVIEAARTNARLNTRSQGYYSRLSPHYERELSAQRLVYDGLYAYAVVAVPFVIGNEHGLLLSGESPLIAVAYQKMTPGYLSRFSKDGTLNPLKVNSFKSSVLHVPLLNGEGQVVAHLETPPHLPGDQLRQLMVPFLIAGILISLTLFLGSVGHVRKMTKELAHTREQVQNMAGRDPLSGLGNRLVFEERLDQELHRLERSDDALAVLFLDLDRFKDVNDTYGHQAGDQLIKLAAQRFLEALRGADTLARFGGDEFAIIQTHVKSHKDAEALARRILDSLLQPFSLDGIEVVMGASIGIALAPYDSSERQALLRQADAALYQSKSEGRNRYSFFERQMDDNIRIRKTVEDDLRRAITEGQLEVYYQPLVSAVQGHMISVEALVRWNHPKQGMINPDKFITIAEERGLIIPLGDWVLRKACEDGQRWPNLRIAVNVSAVQFRHREYVQNVARILEETGFNPARLELELTEGVLVEDADAAEAAIMDLRALGIHLALDDFGTGYSSLIYLRRFAFDKIKIDRSFLGSLTTDGESAILVHSIVHLGRALGLTVTAEGIETHEQKRFLQALGCHEFQGYLFSRPVPAFKIDELVELRTLEPQQKSAAA